MLRSLEETYAYHTLIVNLPTLVGGTYTPGIHCGSMPVTDRGSRLLMGGPIIDLYGCGEKRFYRRIYIRSE